MTNRLPPELIRQVILESLPTFAPELFGQSTCHTARRTMLWKLCLVDHVFHEIAKEELWRKLILDGGKSQGIKFIKAANLESNSLHRLIVREVRFWGPTGALIKEVLQVISGSMIADINIYGAFSLDLKDLNSLTCKPSNYLLSHSESSKADLDS